MELGNLLFGNSRGPVEMPYRDLVDSKSWKGLMDALQIDSYHCIMSDYYNGKKRDNGLTATETGGYRCLDKNGNCLFEISPYQWCDDCTCGADNYNDALDEELDQKYQITREERELYFDTMDVKKLSDEQKEAYNEAKKKMDKKADEYALRMKSHDPGCPLMKHNFVFRPGTEEEFWMEWYKYPFRDSYMSKEMKKEEIEAVFKQCAEDLKSI